MALSSPNHKNDVYFILVCIFLLYYGGCKASATEYSEIKERLIAIAAKVDAIDAKLNSRQCGQDLETLLNRIDQRLDSIDTKLDSSEPRSGLIATGASVQINEEKIPEDGQETQEEQEDFPYYTCVNLISVERNPADEGNIFVVKFTKNAPEILVRYHDEMGPEKRVDTMVDEGDGILSVSFFLNFSENPDRSLWLSFLDVVDEEKSFLSYRHMSYLSLNNSAQSYSFQSIEPMPDLHVEPPRQVVYQPGHDFNVTAFAPLGSIEWDYPYILASFTGINITSGEAFMMATEKAFHELETDDTDDEKVEKSLTVLTSSSTLSGYLSFSFGIDIKGPVVQTMQVDRSILIRPSNQPRVLPSGFLAFLNNPHMQRSDTGNELQPCGSGHECVASCYGVGDPISNITVFKVSPDGSHAPVGSAVNPDLSAGGETLKAVFWKFQAVGDDSDDGNGITTFECVATDGTGGRTVTKKLDLLVMTPNGLDEDESNVTVSDDHMDPNIKHLTFSCAVYGRPLPDVTFYGGTSYIFSLSSSEPDDVITTGANRAVYIKNLTIDIDNFRDRGYRYYHTDVAPSCELLSNTGGFVKHHFEVPDIGLFDENQ